MTDKDNGNDKKREPFNYWCEKCGGVVYGVPEAHDAFWHSDGGMR